MNPCIIYNQMTPCISLGQQQLKVKLYSIKSPSGFVSFPSPYVLFKWLSEAVYRQLYCEVIWLKDCVPRPHGKGHEITFVVNWCYLNKNGLNLTSATLNRFQHCVHVIDWRGARERCVRDTTRSYTSKKKKKIWGNVFSQPSFYL